jgi:hypothetical protein
LKRAEEEKEKGTKLGFKKSTTHDKWKKIWLLAYFSSFRIFPSSEHQFYHKIFPLVFRNIDPDILMVKKFSQKYLSNHIIM